MRRITAFSIAVLLTIPAHALANNDAPSEIQRNPIVWLFEDLGDLLTSASNGIQAPAIDTEPLKSTSKKQEDQPAPKVALATAVSSEFKNPFKAIFNDLVKLFKPSTTTAAEEAPIAETIASVLVDTEVAQKVEANVVSETASASTQRNPIAWLFSDIASLLTPKLEIDDQPSPRKTVVITEAAPAPASKPVVEETQAIVTPPVPQKTALAPAQQNPISW